MKKFNWWIMTAVIILVSGFSYMAYGQAMPIPDNPGEFIKYIIENFQGGHVALGFGLVIMFGVWITSKFLKIDNKWLPFVSSGYGVITAILASVISGMSWFDAVCNGLLLGAAASGFWSQIGKRFLPKK